MKADEKFFFRDMCKDLGGKIEPSEYFPDTEVCIIENDGHRIEIEVDFKYNTLELRKDDIPVLIVNNVKSFGHFPSTILPSGFYKVRKGKKIKCFKSETADICINERGDIEYAHIFEKLNTNGALELP